ncbi:hypothetical protein SYK_02690 [Pseudodesulfovibrio nedwellii]|uniref:VRR-NUC domain-containing protein n=1 Tax=Pseudodesulfovibrio nedwellii TaxID=2973072 RepID=A0ABM8AWX1_9BACT|nr:VRR-NUC domain-containing protein [Pseudodesulfovibrio nedwellii]BDQ35909.1 hypothetical protein SYK_02690 [Pseudodesulfovibrio nedwellii]
MSGQETYTAAQIREMGGLDKLLKSERPMARLKDGKAVKTENTPPLEHDEQVAFFEWAEGWLPEEFYLLLWATPNGGHRFAAVAAKLKAEGVKAGVPDIFFAWARLGYHGLFIEMKRVKGGSISQDQKRMIEILRFAGFLVVVCKGCEEAREAMLNYTIGNGKEFEE